MTDISVTETLEGAIAKEIELVQGKIDSIGEFQFKIRAWSITATSGVVIIGLSHKVTPEALFINILAALTFWSLEVQQRAVRMNLSERAVALENSLAKFFNGVLSRSIARKAALKNLLSVPGIARTCQKRRRLTETLRFREDLLYYLQILLCMILYVVLRRHEIWLLVDRFLFCAGADRL
jgi:hypothetical protein